MERAPAEDVRLSLIVPAYNEATRLPPFLDRVREHLDARYGDGYEVLVVDDGSDDATAERVSAMAATWPRLELIRHEKNRGKGAAVRTGMLAGRGEFLLFADADGATPIDEEAGLAEAISSGADVAVGSRLVADGDVTRKRTWFRGLLGRMFALVARTVLGIPVRDTQCGFKMFGRDTGREIFTRCRESGFLFDLEVLGLAARRGLHIAEVPVDWSEVPGGHLSLRRELIRLLPSLWRLRRRIRAEG